MRLPLNDLKTFSLRLTLFGGILIFELLPQRHGIYSRFKDKKALLQNIKTAFQKADLNRDGLINDVVAKECYIVLDLTKKALAHCFKEPEIPECFRETSFK